MGSDKENALDALFGARVDLRVAEDALIKVGIKDPHVHGAALHIINARGEIDEALHDLRLQGKVD